jgi:hypothetical protein
MSMPDSSAPCYSPKPVEKPHRDENLTLQLAADESPFPVLAGTADRY